MRSFLSARATCVPVQEAACACVCVSTCVQAVAGTADQRQFSNSKHVPGCTCACVRGHVHRNECFVFSVHTNLVYTVKNDR